MMAKLLALLYDPAVGYGLGTAFGQQAPTENKGMKTDPLSGFPLGKQGLGRPCSTPISNPPDHSRAGRSCRFS
jgi:hypothetical protein